MQSSRTLHNIYRGSQRLSNGRILPKIRVHRHLVVLSFNSLVHLKMLLNVTLDLQEKMLHARNVRDWHNVHAFRHTLEILTQVAVVRNVFPTKIAPVISLAADNVVRIRALERVDKMLCAL